MKKHLLAAAALATAALTMAPTTTEAIPAFARQTGSACLSCHFQTFPALTAFGRAFKQNAFTDVGEEALIEDEGLSIPAVLNATIVVRGNYTNTKTTTATPPAAFNAAQAAVNAAQAAVNAAQAAVNAPGGNTAANQAALLHAQAVLAQAKANVPPAPSTTTGVWNIPSETPLLIAGRIGEHTGAFLEFGGGAGGANGTATANFQVMNSFDLGDFKAGLNIFNAGFGWTQGIEVSNVIGQHAGAVGALGDVSAEMQMGFRAANEQGIALWAGNDLFTAQLAMIAPDAPGANVKFKLVPGFRVFVTPEVAGWELGIGFGAISGKKTYGNNAASYAIDNQFIDFQAQGEVNEMQIGFYADYAQSKYKVPNVAVPAANRIVWGSWAAGAVNGDKNQGFSLRATVKPLHNLIFGIGYGQVKYKPTTAGVQGVTQKMTKLALTYQIYQNFVVNLAYWTTKNAGWVKGTKVTNTMLEFEALM